MRNECKTGIEKAWLAAGLAAFVLHRLLEVENGAGELWLLEGLLIVLTLPFGPIAMLFLAFMDFSWLLDWSTLLVVGYIQWFFVLPEIRRNNRLITLNLSSPADSASPPGIASRVEIATPCKTVPPVEIAAPVEIVSPPAPPGDALTVPEILSPTVFNAAAFVPPFAEFDEAGLSALDRVLRAGETQTPAPPMPHSHVETLFLPAASRA